MKASDAYFIAAITLFSFHHWIGGIALFISYVGAQCDEAKKK